MKNENRGRFKLRPEETFVKSGRVIWFLMDLRNSPKSDPKVHLIILATYDQDHH